jgi:hypothetical protein
MESFGARACSACHSGRRSARSIIICALAARNGVGCHQLNLCAPEDLDNKAGKRSRIIYCSSCGRQLH